MTRFVVDATALIHLVSERIGVAGAHELLAPTLVRSQTLSLLHEAVHRGEIPADVGRDRLARIGQVKIRYLGDAVLRRRAWDLADKLALASTDDQAASMLDVAPAGGSKIAPCRRRAAEFTSPT